MRTLRDRYLRQAICPLIFQTAPEEPQSVGRKETINIDHGRN